MEKITLFFFFLFYFSIRCSSQITIKGQVLTKGNNIEEPLPQANISVYNMTDTVTPLKGTTTTEDGTFAIVVKPNNYKLSVSFLGYKMHFIDLNLLEWQEANFNVGDIFLEEDQNMLSDIIIETKRVRKDIDKKIITFTDEQINNAKEFRDLMLNLPYLLVNKFSNTLTTLNGKGVLLLINGVKSNDAELKLIPVNRIKKVEYYDIPPIRYNASGIVLNVITKGFESGCAGDLYLMTAQFYSMLTPYISYITGKHKFTLGTDLFITPKRKIKDFYEGRYIYSLDNTPYEYSYQKEEQNWNYQQNVNFSYSNLKENDYIFQSKITVGFTKDNYNENRNVYYVVGNTLDSKKGLLTNRIKTFSPALDLYYSKRIKEVDELNINVVSSINKNRQNIYSGEQGLFPFKDESEILIMKKTLIGEVNYLTSIAQQKLSLGYRINMSLANNNVKNNTSKLNEVSNNISLQEHYLYGETSGQIKKNSYRISLGVKLNTSNTSSGYKKQFSFIPILILGKSINDNNYIRLIYKASSEMPQIQQFSDNSILVMPNMVRKGNPNLETSVNHDARLNYSHSSRLFDTDLYLFYQNYKNYIFNFLSKESVDNKTFITFSNINAAKNFMYGVETDLSVKPVRGVKIGCNFSVYRHHFQPTKNVLEFNRYFYPITLYASLQYRNFSLDYYQKLGSSFLDGLYVSSIEKVSYINLGYSYKDLSFKLLYYFPFVKNTFKSYTIDDSVIQHIYTGWLKSKEKTLGLSVSWRFNTSSKSYRDDRNIYNSANDKGTFIIK